LKTMSRCSGAIHHTQHTESDKSDRHNTICYYFSKPDYNTSSRSISYTMITFPASPARNFLPSKEHEQLYYPCWSGVPFRVNPFRMNPNPRPERRQNHHNFDGEKDKAPVSGGLKKNIIISTVVQISLWFMGFGHGMHRMVHTTYRFRIHEFCVFRLVSFVTLTRQTMTGYDKRYITANQTFFNETCKKTFQQQSHISPSLPKSEIPLRAGRGIFGDLSGRVSFVFCQNIVLTRLS
jgi:hypothetical protein